MGLFISRTDGFHTTGMSFEKIKAKFDDLVKDGQIDKNAQLRWSSAEGLYAKNKTWSTWAITRWLFGGSGTVLRGEKFLAAREEIARSLNYAYLNQFHNGMPIGDCVVDQVLERRAREDLGLKPDDDIDPQVLAKKKATLHLRISDLATVSSIIAEINKGRISPVREASQPHFASSVGYMRGPQSQETVEKGTKKLAEAIAKDLFDHDIQHSLIVEGSEAFSAKGFAARLKAGDMIIDAGAKPVENKYGDEVLILDGGLSASNVNKIKSALIKDGVVPNQVQDLLACAELPRYVNACGGRMTKLASALEEQAEKVFSIPPCFNNENIAKEFAVKYDLRQVKENVDNACRECHESICNLKAMSYPDDVISWDRRMQEYNGLMGSLERMDLSMKQLYIISSYKDINYNVDFINAIKRLASHVQGFCMETLELANHLYSRLPQPDNSELNEVRELSPFHVRSPGVMAHFDEGEVEKMIKTGLNLDISAPDILFKDDSMGKRGFRQAIGKHNQRIHEISQNYEKYWNLMTGNLRSYGSDDCDFNEEFRDSLITAIRSNENLTKDIQRRQKILGELTDKGIQGELRDLNAQRRSLLLLLYPRLNGSLRSDDEASDLDELKHGAELVAGKNFQGDKGRRKPISLEQVTALKLVSEQQNKEAGKTVAQGAEVLNEATAIADGQKDKTQHAFQESVVGDYKLLKSLNKRRFVELFSMNTEEFVGVEPDAGKPECNPIHTDAYFVIEENIKHLGHLNKYIKGGMAHQEDVRNSVSSNLWGDLAQLIRVRRRLEEFVSRQEKTKNTNDASSSARETAAILIANAESVQEYIDKLIAGTHSLAYALSMPNDVKRLNISEAGFPDDEILRFNPRGLEQYHNHIDSNKHEAVSYAQKKDQGHPDRVNVGRYLASLTTLAGKLNELKNVRDDGSIGMRHRLLKEQILPLLDETLQKNAMVRNRYDDQDRPQVGTRLPGALTRKEAEKLEKRLTQDRGNLQKLRIDANLWLEQERLRQRGQNDLFAASIRKTDA